MGKSELLPDPETLTPAPSNIRTDISILELRRFATLRKNNVELI